MSMSHSRCARWAIAAAGVLVAAGLAPTAMAGAPAPDGAQAASAAPEQKQFEAGTYIVELAEPPVVGYDGGVSGLRATKPAKGQKVDPASAKVRAYVDHLRGQHDATLSRAGGGTKIYSYGYTFNGFAAELSATAAAKMSTLPDVLAVSANERLALDTSSTPAFLGLTDANGLWNQLGGASGTKKTGGPGEDVIVGIVDGGIWPEHPSVADRDADGKLLYQQVPGWHGKCQQGEQFKTTDCNQKLIGARYYNAGFGGDAGIDEQFPPEFNSPRDFGGHGTHTSTTAVGNFGVRATGDASLFGSVSGIAPRARLATYKSCWGTGGGSCFTVDTVAAIDQAVADGVDVINYSISGSRTSFRDPVEIAFLFAADAGIFVSASAGNSGPAISTVAHPSPWLTTVAAGTHNRDAIGSVTLGNKVTYNGASVNSQPVTAPLVDSVNAGLLDADDGQVGRCYSAADTADGKPVLDPVKVTGKIVVCDRGGTGRTAKSAAVKAAGGAGMILVNTSVSSINADLHLVPTVHLQSTDRTAVKAYAATAGATATINRATIVTNAPAPFTASFSSRGPLMAGGGDLLKPDLIAPGQDVLAGVAPPGNFGRLFDLYSGTSMSSPHVAGLGALLTDLHPGWSPMAMKSALMTTGYDVKDADVSTAARIFRQGAGHVSPNSAADPGLVFDSSFGDWLGFLCSAQPGGGCGGVPAQDPSDFNSASIAVGALAGSQTVTRTVTNVDDTAATYTASVVAPGLKVTTTPSTLNLQPGQSAAVAIKIETDGAALNTYAGGQLTWTGGGHTVRIPLVVKPVPIAVPAEVSGTGGPISYDVTFGYDGAFSATARGLIAARENAGTVTQDPDQTFDPLDTTGTVKFDVTVLADTTYARISTFDEDVAPGADLDLYLYKDGAEVASSAGGTSAEQISIAAPPAGVYTVYVHGWGVPGGTTPFELNSWRLGSTAAGNMSVTAPTGAVSGTTGNIGLTFPGLAPATKYLGSVAYSSSTGITGLPSPTIVRVDTP